jgi:Ca-activated chloride channel family protein
VRVELLADVGQQGAVVYVLARLEAEAETGADRPPVNLALAIDRSSSMRGPRIRQALRAAGELVGRLGPRDRLTIVGFDSSTRAVFGPEQMTDEARAAANQALADLDTGVGTNLAAAIRKGSELIASGFVRGAISRLILLTDGQPSVGVTDASRLCRLVEKEYERGVSITTMGVGEGFEDELLSEMARRGRGGFHYLATAADIPAAFGRELDGVFAIAATDAQIKMVPHADVVSVDLLHRLPSRVLEEGLQIDIGEVASGAPRQVLLKLVRNPLSKSRNLGTVMVTHRKPGGDKGDPHLIGLEIPAELDPAVSRQVQDERLRLAVAAAVDAAWARRASGDSGQALGTLVKIRERVLEAAEKKQASRELCDALLVDMAAAEEAVQKSAAERARLRRNMREQSHVTLVGRSVVSRLPREDE